ncbi:chemotaxis protein CheW [Pseudomonadota bacterium]
MTIVEKKEGQKVVSHLVEHELALKVYLDSLLFEDAATETETVEKEAETKPKAVTKPKIAVMPPTVAPVLDDVELEIKLRELAPPKVDVSTPSKIKEEIKTEVVIEPQLQEEVAVPPPEQDAPGWSDGTFECLMFKVAGSLTLSVPLTRLNGILPWGDKITAVPGHAEWFLGLLQNRGKQVKVVDIAKFVIPENHKARESLEQGRGFSHIVLIDDGQFGLACDGLGDVLKLNKDQVRWRSDRSLRPWLAGTVIDHMSALIDVEHFIDMLKEDGVPDDIS